MKLTLIIFLLTEALALSQLGLKLQKLAGPLQSWCVGQFQTPQTPLLQAFICGKDLANNSLRHIWIQTGLYHLLVVSGGHLVFLEMAIELIGQRVLRASAKWENWVSVVTIVVLVLFTLTSGFQPPLVRALAKRMLAGLSKHFHLHWTELHLITASGIFCLMLMPAWVGSPSLMMSWAAAIALTLGRTAGEKALAVYLLMLPCLWGWGQLHPLGVLVNILCAPLATISLFVAAGGYFFSPTLAQGILRILMISLEKLSELMPLAPASSRLNPTWTWLILITVVVIRHGQQISKRRRQWSWDS